MIFFNSGSCFTRYSLLPSLKNTTTKTFLQTRFSPGSLKDFAVSSRSRSSFLSPFLSYTSKYNAAFPEIHPPVQQGDGEPREQPSARFVSATLQQFTTNQMRNITLELYGWLGNLRNTKPHPFCSRLVTKTWLAI